MKSKITKSFPNQKFRRLNYVLNNILLTFLDPKKGLLQIHKNSTKISFVMFLNSKISYSNNPFKAFSTLLKLKFLSTAVLLSSILSRHRFPTLPSCEWLTFFSG